MNPYQTQQLNDLELDLARTAWLAHFMRHWGVPRERTKFRCFDEVVAEIYRFDGANGVHRYCTFGLFRFTDLVRTGERIELLLPVDANRPSYAPATAVDALCAVLRHVLSQSLRIDISTAIGPCGVPEPYPAFAFLDEARGESPDVGEFHIGDTHVALLWYVPVHAAEAALMERAGPEAFDAAVERAGVELIDVTRPSCV